INKATGWGRCFNAACEATVLVAEWNRPVAKRLIQFHYQGLTSAALPSYQPPSMESRHRPYIVQPMLLPPPKSIPQWQQDELHALHALDERMRLALVQSQRARMYLRERGIPLQAALATGVGYLPSALLNGPEMRKQRGLLRRWTDRMLFPLSSPDGTGYIGRSLWHWQPGMNETIHKTLLERPGSPRRWIKTSPAGWFGVDLEQFPQTIILVEGAFDRLTLLAAGFQAADIIALVGTAVQVDWLPAQVKTVVLALDGDEGGKEASSRLADQLAQVGLRVQVCPLVQDAWGKDWNERWQRMGRRSVASVFEAFSEARSA
ncbi:MAG TPA: toprim domain-containing protein, partial [Ktedonobacteraceae bacterium]|nr:toprim domain-containing protein [Ktedonobacteraceae bacterium]